MEIQKPPKLSQTAVPPTRADKAQNALRNFLKRFIIGSIITVSALGINILLYFALTRLFHVNYLVSNAWAWLAYVVFLYALRKYNFFRKTAQGFKAKFREFYLFVGLRLGTGILDMAMMFVLVSLMAKHPMNAKFVVMAVITVINMALGNFWVFRKPKPQPAETKAKPDDAETSPGFDSKS